MSREGRANRKIDLQQDRPYRTIIITWTGIVKTPVVQQLFFGYFIFISSADSSFHAFDRTFLFFFLTVFFQKRFQRALAIVWRPEFKTGNNFKGNGSQ